MGIVGRRGPNGKKRPSRAVSVRREPLQRLDERPKLHRATMDDEIKTQGEHGQSPGERDKPPGSHIDLPETRHRHSALVGCPCNSWPAIGQRPRGELLRAQLNPTKRKKQQRVAEPSFDANIRQQRPTSLTPTTPTSAPDQLTLNRQLLPGEHRRQAN